MADDIQILVGNEVVSLGVIWAHLKKRPRGRTETFALNVPLCHAATVLGRLREKPEGQPWIDFVRAHFREATSFEVEAWFHSACQIAAANGQRPEWVICGLTDVSATESAIAIHGIAEQFNPELYR